MTSIFSNSSKYLRDINTYKPSINPEPKGISLLNFLGWVEIIKIALKEPINKTGARASGPTIVPMPPNNMKSPPPIPSFLCMILKKKFTIHKER